MRRGLEFFAVVAEAFVLHAWLASSTAPPTQGTLLSSSTGNEFNHTSSKLVLLLLNNEITPL